MDVNEAKNKCEKENKDFLVVECIPFKNLFVFNLRAKDRSQNDIVMDSYFVSVNKITGEIKEFSIQKNIDEFMKAAENIIRF